MLKKLKCGNQQNDEHYNCVKKKNLSLNGRAPNSTLSSQERLLQDLISNEIKEKV